MLPRIELKTDALELDRRLYGLLSCGFRSTDNIPRSEVAERDCIMDARASMLIHSHLNSGKLPTVLPCGTRAGGLMLFPVPSSIARHVAPGVRLYLGWLRDQPNPFLKGEVPCGLCEPASLANPGLYYLNHTRTNRTVKYAPHHCAELVQKGTFLSIFRAIRLIHPNLSANKLCRRLGIEALPYGAEKLPLGGRLWLDPVGDTLEDLLERHGTVAGGTKDHQGRQRGMAERLSRWDHMPFTDERGEVKFLLTKEFDVGSQTKRLLPKVSLCEAGRSSRITYAHPIPGKQLLYNQHLLAKYPEAPVVLAPSPEIAQLNQTDRRVSPFIWVAFMCDEGQYEQVDFSALEGRPVYLLITNYSGISLEQAYQNVAGLAQYLTEELDLGIDLRFAQVETVYPAPKRQYAGLEDLKLHMVERPPATRPNSVAVMDRARFEELRALAEESMRPRRFYDGNEAVVEVVCDSECDSSGQVVLRGWLESGCVTLLSGGESSGKTALCFSASGAVIAGVPLLNGRCLTTPKSCVGAVVVYVDFETPEPKLSQRKEVFLYPYLSTDESTRQEQESRFRHVPMRGRAKDYTRQENQQELLDIIAENTRDLSDDTPVLVVIDTLLKLFGGHEYNDDWAKVKPLLDRITGAGAAVLLAHHTNDDDDPSGSKDKRRDADFSIVIGKVAGGSRGTLRQPIRVQLEKGRENEIDADAEEFHIQYCRDGDDGKEPAKADAEGKGARKWRTIQGIRDSKGKVTSWVLADGNGARQTYVRRIAPDYEDAGRSPEAVADLLGVGRSTYFELKKPLANGHGDAEE